MADNPSVYRWNDQAFVSDERVALGLRNLKLSARSAFAGVAIENRSAAIASFVNIAADLANRRSLISEHGVSVLDPSRNLKEALVDVLERDRSLLKEFRVEKNEKPEHVQAIAFALADAATGLQKFLIEAEYSLSIPYAEFKASGAAMAAQLKILFPVSAATYE